MTREPCRLCAEKVAGHAEYGPHCPYCGQGYQQGEQVGGYWFKGVQYEGHVACMQQAGGTEFELFILKRSLGLIPDAEYQTHVNLKEAH
jgi:hypothetical protein